MGKERSGSCKEAARRAWRLIRLALIWARKGGLLKCRLIAELRQGAKCLTGGLNNNGDMDMIWYAERQLSFDDTPIIHLRMSRSSGSSSLRFLIPCIKTDVVDFDCDFDDDDDDVGWGLSDEGGIRKGFLENKAEDDDRDDDEINKEGQCEEDQMKTKMMMMNEEDESIDAKDEEFIAKLATDFFSTQLNRHHRPHRHHKARL